MRRLALPLAIGALLAIVGLTAGTLLRPSAPDPAATAASLAGELRCPDCEGLSVSESPSRSAAEVRRQIEALLAEGRTPEAVRQHFVDRYGEWILLAPRSPLPWLAPAALLLVAVAAFALWIRGRAPAPHPVLGGEVTPAARRVREEAEALDA